ncbi:GntR family transcriptional regulator [Trueperella sp. LYQ143]|uniref:GntR family transcriptional regulator n=1 Tax=unclassified Trueperella TaxID=2630174 RepID=UPI0039836AF9
MLERKALRDGVSSAILDLLVSGHFGPGDSLSIEGLAKRFGVSPTPVREALAELEHTGLVTRAALKGYRVAPPITAEQIRQLVDVRIILEVSALERAYPHRADMRDRLLTTLESHRRAAQDLLAAHDGDTLPSYKAYFAEDWGLHQVFLDYCDNQYLSDMTNSLSFNMHRMRQAVGTNTTDAEDAVREHEAVVEAFLNGSLEEAKAALVTHLRGVLERSVSDVEKAHPEAGTRK